MTEEAISPLSLEDEAIEAARSKLLAAKEQHVIADQVLKENANEYAKEGTQEKLLQAARDAQMKNAGAWYKFWETATKIPKDGKYHTFTSNEKRTWKEITEANEGFMREIVNGELEGVTWKKVSNKGGIELNYSPEQSEVLKTKLYKVEFSIQGTNPKLAILPLVRGPLLGEADEDLIYFREHYNFVGGATSLVHTVRKLVSLERVSPRDFFDLTHWSEDEDGTIFLTSTSIKALNNKMPGVVRGATLFKGFCIRPTEAGDVDVTMISQVDPKGWVPNAVLNWYAPAALVDQAKALQASCETVKEGGDEERLVRKFVLRELDVE